MTSIRLFVIHRSRLLSDTLATALNNDSIEVVGHTPYLNEAIRRLRQTPADMILLEADSRGTSARVRQLRNTFPGLKVLPIGADATSEHMLSCIEAGACGFVTADTSLPDLVDTLRLIQVGRAPCSPELALSVFNRMAELSREREEEHEAGQPTSALTPRETEILQEIDAGLRNKEIARRLDVSLSTIKNHVHRILEKLRVTRRSEAVQRAYELGLLQPGNLQPGSLQPFPIDSKATEPPE